MLGISDKLPEALAPDGFMESEAADMATLYTRAYELGELIKQSALTAEYHYYKDQVDSDERVKELSREFAKAKELFAECERFGRFHPSYNEALERVYEVQARLDEIEPVRKFKLAEQSVDNLLHDVALLIARSVSDSIKVPDNDPNPKGCGSGGACSCGGGGCG
ncbi:YlbF family regulator [Cohnella sp. AR92]|uniref:YlbF family regulator n=1 Tax=Cohnella sp. AR92 TaxID=648716 RepID=UPI000F8E7AE1|nr:YlbF family regulator [Cohnella sp. AR92]RUS48326.1 YlbF family regulator [Cohnella sp. AR92]